MDEPTSALDFFNQALIMKTLRRISAEDGLTVLITTHVPQQVQVLADRVLLMYAPDGQGENWTGHAVGGKIGRGFMVCLSNR